MIYGAGVLPLFHAPRFHLALFLPTFLEKSLLKMPSDLKNSGFPEMGQKFIFRIYFKITFTRKTARKP
jgi:hypothetical protein